MTIRAAKRNLFCMRALLLFTSSLLIALGSGCQSDDYYPVDHTTPMREGRAVVRSVRGHAQFTSSEGWRPLRTGMVLSQGMTLRTQSGSTVDLGLGPNGRSVRLTPETELILERLNYSEGTAGQVETVLNLRQGRIQGKTGKLPPGSRFDVITPSGRADLTGRDFGVNADGRER